MVERLETFPYEVLLVWQRFHRTLTQDEVTRFMADPDVRKLGEFPADKVADALRQTPRLSEAIVIARGAAAGSQPTHEVTRSECNQAETVRPASRRSLQRKLRARNRWRKGGILIRRAQIWAEDNRENPTEAEERLETILRDMFHLIGPIQVQWIFGKPSAPFILDFFLPRARLGIEVDGSIHELPAIRDRDEQKSDEARKSGITLRRFTNNEVLNSSPEWIQEKLKQWFKEAAHAEHLWQRSPR